MRENNPKNNPLNHNVNDNVNEKGVIGGEVATKRRAFVAPSLEMVKDYFLTINGKRYGRGMFLRLFHGQRLANG